MNHLLTFGVNPGVPKTEFVQLFSSHPADHLKSLRAHLFDEVNKCDLVPPSIKGLPLVNRRDTPLRPVAKVLSEDIWSIVMCITTKTMFPRTLLRNGKRSANFLSNTIRSDTSCSITDCASASLSGTQPNSQATVVDMQSVNLFPPIHQSVAEDSHTQESVSNDPQLPPSSNLTNLLISREISTLKDDVRNIKADIACINNRSTVRFQPNIEVQFRRILKDIKDELSHLRTRLNQTVHESQTKEAPTSPVAVTLIKHIYLELRGLHNALPYLHHLITEGSNIIAINEHWLWPFQLNSLNNIHSDYRGYGVSDHRLNAESNLTRGCGGAGIIWNTSLKATPLSGIQSDRICAIRISLRDSSSIMQCIFTQLRRLYRGVLHLHQRSCLNYQCP